jgi:flagellar hook-length control protein FliK
MTAIAAPTAALPAAPTPAVSAKTSDNGFDALLANAGKSDDAPAPRAPSRPEPKSDARDDARNDARDARDTKAADKPARTDSKSRRQG